MTTSLVREASVLILSMREPSGVSPMASPAFMIRLSTTCCSCTRSAEISRGSSTAEIGSKRNPSAVQLAAQEREDLFNDFVDIEAQRSTVIFLEHAADARYKLTCSIAVTDDLVDVGNRLGNLGRGPSEPA